MKTFVMMVSILTAFAASARADQNDSPAPAGSVRAVLDGDLSTFLHGPTGGARAMLVIAGGWDGATDGARADASGLLPVYGRFSLLLGANLGTSQQWRPSAGVSVALIAPRHEGPALHLIGQYKAEGFTEPEGELELTVRSGYRFAHASLLGEVSYGQDPEGNERDAELAADGTWVHGAASVGLGVRGRKGFGVKEEAVAWDLVAGPHLGLVVAEGHFVGLSGGLSLLSLDGATRAGALGLVTYGASY